MALRPFDLIHKSINKEVTVSMKDGSVYVGRLISYDENLNLFLKGVKDNGLEREFASIVLKGGNIVSVSPSK